MHPVNSSLIPISDCGNPTEAYRSLRGAESDRRLRNDCDGERVAHLVFVFANRTTGQHERACICWEVEVEDDAAVQIDYLSDAFSVFLRYRVATWIASRVKSDGTHENCVPCHRLVFYGGV